MSIGISKIHSKNKKFIKELDYKIISSDAEYLKPGMFKKNQRNKVRVTYLLEILTNLIDGDLSLLFEDNEKDNQKESEKDNRKDNE